jgi:hypothetical protein
MGIVQLPVDRRLSLTFRFSFCGTRCLMRKHGASIIDRLLMRGGNKVPSAEEV